MGWNVVEHKGHSELGLLNLHFIRDFTKAGKLTWKDSQ